MALIQASKSGALQKAYVRLPTEILPNVQTRDHYIALADTGSNARMKSEKLIYLQTYHANNHAYVFCKGLDELRPMTLHVHYNEGWCIDILSAESTDIFRIRIERTDKYAQQEDCFKAMIWRAMVEANEKFSGWRSLVPHRLRLDVVRNGEELFRATEPSK